MNKPELTQQVIDEIRDTLSKATPAPWRYDGQHYEITAPAAKGDDPYWLISSECRSAPDQQHECDEFGHEYDNNYALIEKLRNNAEALLAYAEYGLKAKAFFREMEDRQPWIMTKYGEPVDVPANCEKCRLCALCEPIAEKDAGILCRIITDAAKAAGLEG